MSDGFVGDRGDPFPGACLLDSLAWHTRVALPPQQVFDGALAVRGDRERVRRVEARRQLFQTVLEVGAHGVEEVRQGGVPA